jgi:HEAT repeat protein
MSETYYMGEDDFATRYDKAVNRAMRYWIPCFEELVDEPLEIDEIDEIARAGELIDKLINNPSPQERALAAWELVGSWGSRCAVDYLIKALDDEHEDVRAHAANALGTIGDDKALSKLEQTLDDVSEKVRIQVLKAISKINEQQKE